MCRFLHPGVTRVAKSLQLALRTGLILQEATPSLDHRGTDHSTTQEENPKTLADQVLTMCGTTGIIL